MKTPAVEYMIKFWTPISEQRLLELMKSQDTPAEVLAMAVEIKIARSNTNESSVK